jgi:hypothetical protein
LLVACWQGNGLQATALQYVLFTSVIFVSHWWIDAFDLAQRWGNLIGQTKVEFVRMMNDQVLHLLVIGALVQWLFVY